MAQPALLLVDLQKDFLRPKSGHVGRMEKAICFPGVCDLLRLAREERWKVVHIVTQHADATTLPAHLVRRGTPPYCCVGTEGAEIVRGLEEPTDPVVTKTHYSGFRGTALKDHLREHETVVVAGIAVDCCVLLTAFDAEQEGKRVFVPFQAVGASTERSFVGGLGIISKSAGAVLDLPTMLRDRSPHWPSRLEGARLDSALESWFQERKRRLDASRSDYDRWLSEEGADRALRRLADRLR